MRDIFITIKFIFANLFIFHSILILVGKLIGISLTSSLVLIFLYSLILFFYLKDFNKSLNIFLINLIFYFSVLVMIERSGTVYMFKIIDKENEILVNDLEHNIKKGYLNDSFVKSRLNEQIIADNIFCNTDDVCILTKKGNLFINIYKFYASLGLKLI